MNILHKVAMTMKSLPLFWHIWNVDKGILYEALETWDKRFWAENYVDQMCWSCLVIALFMVMDTWEEVFWTQFLCSRVLGILQLCNLAPIRKFGFQLPMSNNKGNVNWSPGITRLTLPTFILRHLDALIALFWMPICPFVIVDWLVFSTFYNLLLIEFGTFAKLLKHT
jgi:hypothetical protein